MTPRTAAELIEQAYSDGYAKGLAEAAAPLRDALRGLVDLASTGGALAHLNRHGIFSEHTGAFNDCGDKRCVKARDALDTARRALDGTVEG